MQTQRQRAQERILESARALEEESIERAIWWSVLLNGDEFWKGSAVVVTRATLRNPA